MKCISLWQPWASAIALGHKRIETRSWSTNYRGPIAIHAAKRWDAGQQEFAMTERAFGRLPGRLPFGAIVAVARLVGVKRTGDLVASCELTAVERLYGDYAEGRYGWILEGIIPLPLPIGFKGSQGFFEVPDDILAQSKLAAQKAQA